MTVLRFARRLRLDGELSTSAAKRVVDAVRMGPRSPCDQEQSREREERFFYSFTERRGCCYCVSCGTSFRLKMRRLELREIVFGKVRFADESLCPFVAL